MPSPPASPVVPRPQPPREPELSPAAHAAQGKQASFFREREGLERKSVLRGLVLLALVVAAISLFRAGLHRAFYTGWWRQW